MCTPHAQECCKKAAGNLAEDSLAEPQMACLAFMPSFPLFYQMHLFFALHPLGSFSVVSKWAGLGSIVLFVVQTGRKGPGVSVEVAREPVALLLAVHFL